jgi:MoxR-like ATPase
MATWSKVRRALSGVLMWTLALSAGSGGEFCFQILNRTQRLRAELRAETVVEFFDNLRERFDFFGIGNGDSFRQRGVEFRCAAREFDFSARGFLQAIRFHVNVFLNFDGELVALDRQFA